MSITSFYFLGLAAIHLLAYYIVPGKVQWIVLLAASLGFYYLSPANYTIVYLVTSTLIAYLSTIWIDHQRKKNEGKDGKGICTAAIIAIVLNIIIWFVVKGRDLWLPVLQIFDQNQTGLQLTAALGMGYYTLQILGYIIDCYWGNIEPQKNPLKLFLFAAYFPQLTTGPINRYAQMKTLFEPHRFSYQNITRGAQRILWGFIKKLVLAERFGAIITAINADPVTYVGFYSWMVILLYPLQMYTDFSGCMDIVLGVSEMFGIQMAENFNNPFFSRTSQEFWQRWHITLGTWAKDYVLYPLLKSRSMVQLSKSTRKKFGKRTGKFLVNLVGMFILWMVMGVWHGGWKYIIGVSLWYWVILMLGDLGAPLFQKITEKLNIDTENFSWHLFQSLRTYLIYAVGAAFFCLGVKNALLRLQDALKVIFVKDYANPWIFFDESILKLGVAWGDINILLAVTPLLLIVGILREKYGYAREWVGKQNFVFRWFIWLAMFTLVLVYGKYGPGYNSADFIYQGF